jgi:hypothetical protein
MTGRSTTSAARSPLRGAAALVGVPARVVPGRGHLGRGLLGGVGGLLLGAVLGTAGIAGAESLATRSSIGASTAVVGDCGDLSAVRVGYAVTTGTVQSVTLSGVPAACQGASVRVALVSATGAALATAGPVVVTGTSLTLPALSGAPSPGSVAAVHVSAVGP